MPEKLMRAKDVAQILGVGLDTAREIMKTQMRCVCLTLRAEAKMPRYAVTPGEVERWQRERAKVVKETSVAPAVNKHRKRTTANIVNMDDYFEYDKNGNRRIKRRRA